LPPEAVVLKIQRTTEGAAIVLTVCGRLDAENVNELREWLDTIGVSTPIVLDLTDLLLADRDVVRLLREWQAGRRIELRNCPPYIQVWMATEGFSDAGDG
jgi:anti-anti-sigma regulatory factor